GQRLELRAADGARPAIRLLNFMTDLPDAMVFKRAVDEAPAPVPAPAPAPAPAPHPRPHPHPTAQQAPYPDQRQDEPPQDGQPQDEPPQGEPPPGRSGCGTRIVFDGLLIAGRG